MLLLANIKNFYSYYIILYKYIILYIMAHSMSHNCKR